MAVLHLAMERFKSEDRCEYTPGSAVTAGTPVQVAAGLVGVPPNDIAAGETDEVDINGRFRSHGVASEAWTIGDNIGWDADGDPLNGTAGAGALTKDDSAWDFPVGSCVEAKTATTEQGIVLLNEYLEGSPAAGPAGLGNIIADPGDGEAIPVAMSGHCPIVTAGAETRTVADATDTGQALLLFLKTDGGDCTITFASPIDDDGSTTIVLTTVGEHFLFVSVEDGSDIEWRLVSRTKMRGITFDGATGVNHITVPANLADALSIVNSGVGDVFVITTTTSAVAVTFGAAVTLGGAGSNVVMSAPIAAPEDIAAGNPGALSIATYITTVDTDADDDAFTLADGAFIGQLKKVKLVTDGGGNAVITPANFQDGTTVTMADAGDYVVFAWEAAGWRAIELGNEVDGITAPVIA